MHRQTRGRGAHHDTRATEIADAVLAVAAEHGLAAVSQNRVAAQAGVSAGRVQHYFPTKQQLLETAFDRANALSSARIAAKTGQDALPREVLTVVLSELIPYDADTEAHMRIRQSFTALALTDPAIAARLREDYTHFHQQIAQLLREDGVLDPDATATGLAAMAEGLAYYVLIDLTPADAARDRIHAAIADIQSTTNQPA
jgi:AcrR family transcriptional regulator